MQESHRGSQEYVTGLGGEGSQLCSDFLNVETGCQSRLGKQLSHLRKLLKLKIYQTPTQVIETVMAPARETLQPAKCLMP